MKLNFIKLSVLMSLVLFFQGCSISQATLQSVAQTNSAAQVVYYKNEVLKSLSTYKKKLDLRNPNSYNKKLSKNIYFQIDSNQDYINILLKNEKLETSKEYLHYAFSKENIKNRNDLLVLGLYKLIYKAYSLQEEHHFAAIQYNKDDMLDLYKYLQVIRWKVRTKKDDSGNYLFKTWQNNWQLELMKKNTSDLNIINDLKYIKSKKENIYSPSNFSFENLVEKMLVNVQHSLKKIDVEPYDLSINALKSFVFII